MGRKSLATERRNELLDAFERCILKYGLEGASLEQVAEEAGMTRSIIRHYIGNRDELIEALIARITSQILEQFDSSVFDLEPLVLVHMTLDMMFAEERTLEARDKVIIDILMTAKTHYPHAKQMLVEMFERLVVGFAQDLQKAYPTATAEACRRVAYAILCLSEMHDSLMWLGMNSHYNADARRSAELLLQTLKG